ncbi:MAG TPA: DUF1150 family protein [Acetobacteraceae bacterium]|jgi:hypothetical protein|nr:DUF1150 family protein [Acetobacteraceae bacterium]
MNMNSADQMNEQNDNAATVVMVDVRKLSPEQFAQLGMTHVAYVKPVIVNGASSFAIHAADGTPMALADNRDVAIAAIVQHEMMPALVH